MYVGNCHSVYKNVAERPRTRPSGGPRPIEEKTHARGQFPHIPSACAPCGPPCQQRRVALRLLCVCFPPGPPAAGRARRSRIGPACVPGSIIGELERGLAAPSLASSSSALDGRTEQALPRVWAQVSSSRFSLTASSCPAPGASCRPLLPALAAVLMSMHTHAHGLSSANKQT